MDLSEIANIFLAYEQTAPVFKMHDRYVYFRSVQIKL